MEKTSTIEFLYYLFIVGLSISSLFCSADWIFKNFFPRQYYNFFKKDSFLSDSEEDALDALLKQKYSALELGPFTAEMGRKTAVMPTFSTSDQDNQLIGSDRITLMTTLSARVQPAHNCAFTIEFPRIIPQNTTTATAMKSWNITCENDELKQFLKSDKFSGIILTLNALAPGAIQCVGNLFRVELHRTLIAEKDLDAFWTISKEAFVKYAQQVQLYLPEWRGYDWWNEVVPDQNHQNEGNDQCRPLPEA